MEVTFNNIIEILRKTTELRKVIEQMKNNPSKLNEIKPAILPAINVLEQQFNTQENKNKFKEDMIRSITKHYSEQIDRFFEDLDYLEKFKNS